MFGCRVGRSCPDGAALDRHEATGLTIERRQLSGRNPEIGAVESNPAALNQLAQSWKGHEIVEGVGNRRLFEAREAVRRVTARTELSCCGRNQRHPFADEVAGRERRVTFSKGAHPAAPAMASTTMCFTFSAPTANSSAADTPW
jgi:hypothetical protein